MAEFLLEVGCEEMPASWLRGTTEQVRQRFTDAAGRERLAPDAVSAFSTSRSCALLSNFP